MKTSKGLVEHAEMALREGFGYTWGAFGQKLTPILFEQKKKQYPVQIGRYESFIRQNWMNKRTVDCVGLIKSYLWWNNGNVKYTPNQDKSADGMYNLAKKKGTIRTIPEIPGLCVWRKGHIGVYIGNGWVIEAQGTVHGVKKTKLSQRNFTHWLECPYISYTKPKEEVIVVNNNPSSWAKDAWKWAKDKGYLDGTRPKDPITREEMALIIKRIVESR